MCVGPWEEAKSRKNEVRERKASPLRDSSSDLSFFEAVCIATFHVQNSSFLPSLARSLGPLACHCQAKEESPRSTEPACARVDRFDINMCKYDSHEEMVGRLRALEVEHPGLAKTGIIGKTVEGRDLFYIKVSNLTSQELYLLCTELAKKVCPRLRDSACRRCGEITQPRTHFFGQLCTLMNRKTVCQQLPARQQQPLTPFFCSTGYIQYRADGVDGPQEMERN